MIYKEEVLEQGKEKTEVLEEFMSVIDAKKIDNSSFTYEDKKWFIDEHPFDHSDDIIISTDDSTKYDYFLLVKTGGLKTRIVGWCTKEELRANSPRDIYRNNKLFYMVNDTNIHDLTNFKILKDNVEKKEVFIINKQKADSFGEKEYIDGLIAGIHHFAKEAKIYFKDINQKDEFVLGDKKVKIYLRDAHSDEDILIRDKYFKAHPEIDYYMVCKIKGGAYWYVGYVDKKLVENTRIVQMIGQDSEKASDDIRRIFAEQLSPMSDLIEIYEEIKEEDKIIEQNYIPLHVHSEFSIGDAYGSPEKLADNYYKKGFKSGALTDHGTMGGVWSFQKAMLSHELKPIIGVELYISAPELEKRAHLTVWVKNDKGWSNLLKLQSMGALEYFYYNPTIPVDKLLEHSEGLMIGSGCVNSLFHKLIGLNKSDLAEKYMIKFKEVFKDDFYGEIQPTIVVDNQRIMKEAKALYDKHSIKCLLTNDVHYANKDDEKVHEAIKAIAFKKNYGEAGYGDNCFYLMSDEDIDERLQSVKENNWMIGFIDEIKKNTFEVMQKADFLIKSPDEADTLPKIKPTIQERKQLLKDMIYEGLEKNTPYKYDDVKDRLDLEINRILSKDYENYFLLVSELVSWSKNNGIMVGPGRGSVGASLAAYALGITTCDPLKFDLLFDRFLSEIRRDMPDVDMDFQDSRRKEVYEYLINRFGREHCAKVTTYSRYHAKGLLRDLARIFNIPIPEIEKICGLVIERSGGDARASFTLLDTFSEFEEAIAFKEKYPLVVELAIKMEGGIRHKGVHAAAMVVTEKPIHHYSPVNMINGEYVIEWEKQQAEDMKLNKLDILGLTTLTIVNGCLEDLPGVELPQEFEDKKVYDTIFKEGKCLGVFQFETVGLSKLSRTLKVDSFQLLHDTTTLFRPGALHSGQTMQYVNRRHGKEEIKTEHPLLDKITLDTKGIILYQEQIMQIMNQIGGMSWATAEMARKVITKSKGKKAFEEMRAEFVRNANKLHGMSQQEAQKLYDVVSTFGSYSFNKAHAVEYSIISYWSAWLKTYYPLVFYKNALKNTDNSSKLLSIMQEMEKAGIELMHPDINLSESDYCIKQGRIYAGFKSIKGIADKSAQKIINNQPYASFEDYIKRNKPSSKILKGLVVADAFRTFNINKKEKYHGLSNVTDFTIPEHAALLLEHTTLKPQENIVEQLGLPDLPYEEIGALTEEQGDKVTVLRGLVTDVLNKDKLLRQDIKKHPGNFEMHMIYLNINDGTGDIAVQVNPWTYTYFKEEVNNCDKKVILVHGKLAKDGQKMYAELIQIGKEGSVTDYYNKKSKINKIMIASSTPAVSKKGKPYYRIELSDGRKGMVFRFTRHLMPGLLVSADIDQAPFMNLTVLAEQNRPEMVGGKENESRR